MFPSRGSRARGGIDRVFRRLTNADYNALYVAVREQMPRVTRQMFPTALQQLVGNGVLAITATAEKVSVRMPGMPEVGTYQVRRLIRSRARIRQRRRVA